VRGRNATSYHSWEKPICTTDRCPWHLRCKHCPRIRSWMKKEVLIVEDNDEEILVVDDEILIMEMNEYVGWPSV